MDPQDNWEVAPQPFMTNEEADLLLSLLKHPAWPLYERNLQEIGRLYETLALTLPYGPYVEGKFRFYQALARNFTRLARAPFEAANEQLAKLDENSL